MPLPSDVRRVVDRHRSQSAALRARLVAYLTAAWAGLPEVRDPQVDRFVSTIVPTVRGAQAAMAGLTAAYLAVVERAWTGAETTASVPSAAWDDARGVDPAEVYRRPAVTVWTALSLGDDFTMAKAKGLARLLDLGTTDLQLAKTRTVRHLIGNRDDIGGYRRVLEGAQSCGMCIVASTQRYRRGDLLPIHPGCDCGVLPIFGDDPGRVIDPDTLDNIRDRIEERFGRIEDQTRKGNDSIPRYQDVLVTHDHGEIGPLLGVRGQHFTPEP